MTETHDHTPHSFLRKQLGLSSLALALTLAGCGMSDSGAPQSGADQATKSGSTDLSATGDDAQATTANHAIRTKSAHMVAAGLPAVTVVPDITRSPGPGLTGRDSPVRIDSSTSSPSLVSTSPSAGTC